MTSNNTSRRPRDSLDRRMPKSPNGEGLSTSVLRLSAMLTLHVHLLYESRDADGRVKG
jgi:hypothetical protein